MTRKRRFRKPDFTRRVYVIPSMVTTFNLFAGFYAIVAATQNAFFRGAIAIFIAGLFDNLDGKIARSTKTTSRFGVEYDSLCDLVSFGVAPAMVMYLWALRPLGRIGWLAAFLFAACGALRLARFNTQVGEVGISHFVGLPIPAAAGMSAATVLLYHRVGWVTHENPAAPYPAILLLMVFALSFLMVSNIEYESFKKPEFAKKKSFNVLVAAVLLLGLIAFEPEIGLFVVGLVYTGHGPVGWLYRRRKKAGTTETDLETPTEKEADTPAE